MSFGTKLIGGMMGMTGIGLSILGAEKLVDLQQMHSTALKSTSEFSVDQIYTAENKFNSTSAQGEIILLLGGIITGASIGVTAMSSRNSTQQTLPYNDAAMRTS